MARLGYWWNEVRRRRVLRVVAWYLAGSWVLAQVADLLFDAFDLSGYTRFVIAALVAGLPVAFVLSWVFIGIPILLALAIWWIVRCVKGLRYVGERSPYPNHLSWGL